MDFGNLNFDPFSMNQHQLMDMLTQVAVTAMLQDAEENLVTKVADYLSDQHVDQSYVDHLACAAYGLMLTTPDFMIEIIGGPIKLAHMMLKHGESDKLNLSALTEKIRHGFADVSPTLSQAITEEIMLLTARLCLNDWLTQDRIPSHEVMTHDMHFYFQAIVERNADIDRIAVKLEGQQRILAMTPEEQAELPPNLLQRILTWKLEDEK